MCVMGGGGGYGLVGDTGEWYLLENLNLTNVIYNDLVLKTLQPNSTPYVVPIPLPPPSPDPVIFGEYWRLSKQYIA